VSLPDPETVVARARDTDPDTSDATANVAVTGRVDADAVDRTDEGYVGDTAGALGRLAAATAVDEDAAIHYPEPDFAADGPWLVLAPLSGFASTVSAGVGRADVTLDYDADADPHSDRLDALVSDLLEASRPTHEHYPVADDDSGVFTRGMTTFALDSLSVDDDLTATFELSTTPATRPSDVESRFASVERVRAVDYETVAGVERSDPSPALRDAVESAHRSERGDCEYDWLPDPGVFAAIPGGEKVAFGTGRPGEGEFAKTEFEACRDLLAAVLSAPEVVA